MESESPEISSSEEKKAIVKIYGQDTITEGDIVRVENKLYRAVRRDTGYTIRQYFSHSTPEKGPGPGWDFRQQTLDAFGVTDPAALPDEPYAPLELEPVDNDPT